MNDNFCRLVADALVEQDAKEERRKLRDWVHYAIGAGFALALLISAFNAIGAEVYKATSGAGLPVTLRITQEPCTDVNVLSHLKAGIQEKYIPMFKRAVLNWEGKVFEACWMQLGQTVLAIDSEGDPFNPPYGVPRSKFRDDTV
jgi:hypothetical protein